MLKFSIQELGLLEPIDVLEVEGQFWGFSGEWARTPHIRAAAWAGADPRPACRPAGCHRFQAHAEAGAAEILCRVRRANRATLRAHMM